METAKTGTGRPFQYKRYPDGHIIVYPQRGGKLQSKSAIAITPFTVDLVKQAIRRAGSIAVGASRDKPPAGSLGEMLRDQGQSPQQLSYLVPLLANEGFCKCVLVDRALVARYLAEG